MTRFATFARCVSRCTLGGVIAALTLLLAVAAMPAAHAQFGTNRLLNGNAEDSPGSNDGGSNGEPLHWTRTDGNFTAVLYGIAGGFPTLADPGPVDRGLNFFAGSDNFEPFSAAMQDISVTDVASFVDAGTVSFNASGYFGGFESQDDNAVLRLAFRNASNTVLSTVTVGGVQAAERGNATGMLFRQLNGAVPVGTRTITASLEMTRLDGSYNDGYADNLDVRLTNGTAAVPEPGTVTLLLLGGGVLLGVVRRRGHAA